MSRRPTDLARTVLTLALVLLLPGCSTWQPLREPVAEAVAIPDAETHVLVHLHDGTRLELEIREVTADSLRGWAYGVPGKSKLASPSAKHGHPVSLAQADIAKIESRQKDAALTVACVLGIVGVAAATAVAISIASWAAQ